jgi:hypothetical protein
MMVGEHELPELEITKYDPLIMAGADSFRDLPEQSSSLRFPEPLPKPHVRVQVPMSWREHEVQELFSEEHLMQGVDVRVRIYPVVG